jgi:hypothetical protein
MPHASRSTTLSWHPARSAQGLDSATTYSVVNSLHELVGALQMSCVISLLQVGSRQDSDNDAATRQRLGRFPGARTLCADVLVYAATPGGG